MSTLDIRDFDEDIEQITFANAGDVNDSHITNTGYYLVSDHIHTESVFLHTDDDFVAIRKRDIPNLIKGLEKALEIWKD